MGIKVRNIEESLGGLYIHVPFCRKKCFYCDFYSVGSSRADFSNYVNSLVTELSLRNKELPEKINTLYFGGGTPSLIPAKDFIMLVSNLERIIPDCWNREGDLLRFIGEFTIEVNPEDVSEDACSIWKQWGVNRVSMGVQSFRDDELQRIGRHHSAKKAIEAIETLKKYFDNISIDLIFGLPGQSLHDWEKNLMQAVASGVQHISLYSLMFEDGTPMTILRNRGKIRECEEEVSVEMFRKAQEVFEKTGFKRYEISNYSLPGFESRHNSSYWEGSPYLGLGPGAHSYDGNRVRRMNPCALKDYMMHYQSGVKDFFYQEEHLSDTELKEEYILTRMRTVEGIEMADYAARFGEEAAKMLERRARAGTIAELVNLEDGQIKLSSDGVMVSDRVILKLSDF